MNTVICLQALVSLLSTQDGEGANFMECDCDGNNVCQRQKRRLSVCSHDVMAAMESIKDDDTQISCSLAELICRADTPCLFALNYYQKHCQRLFIGDRCTSRYVIRQYSTGKDIPLVGWWWKILTLKLAYPFWHKNHKEVHVYIFYSATTLSYKRSF